MKIEIPWAKPFFGLKEKEYLNNALESTWISGGYYIDKFEMDFIEIVKSKYGITTSNGTTALQLAVMGLEIGEGDEVIVPGFTFVAPANMVLESGAKVVYADIDPETWCIDPKDIERHITSKTKAVIPVHIYGNVCDMEPILNLARQYNLFIIEDTAEAAFSMYKGKYAGTFGDIGCFSFQATKTVTMGEGGLVLTDNDKLRERMRTIRDHGMRRGKRYWHDMVGYNFRLTNLQAAVGCGQLEYIDEIIKNRKRVYNIYKNYLENIDGIKMQKFNNEVEPVVWAIAIKLDSDYFLGDRDYVISALLKMGIECRPGFYPFSKMPVYDAPILGVCEDVGMNVMSLPSYPSLSEDEIGYICENLLKLRK